jgi:hypothetical protein
MLEANTAQYSGAKAATIMREALTQITGLDGSSVKYDPAELKDRESRLNSNINHGLLHQSGIKGARGIIESGRMNKGESGIAAGGIYFAVTPNDTMCVRD